MTDERIHRRFSITAGMAAAVALSALTVACGGSDSGTRHLHLHVAE